MSLRLKLKVNKKDLFLFLLLLPMMEPYAFGVMFKDLNRLFVLFKILVSIYIAYRYIRTKILKRQTKSPITIAWTCFWAFLIVNTLVRGDMTNNFISGSLCMISCMMLIDMNMDYPKRTLNVLMVWADILIYVNFATMLLFPNGLYQSSVTSHWENWLLGYDNFFEQVFIPALTIAFIYGYLYRKYFRAGLLIAIIHLSAAITTPGTLVFCLLYMDAMLFLGIYRMKRVFSLKNLIVVILGVTAGIILFDFQTRFGGFIFSLLNKDVTFTGRTRIWELSLYQISRSPIWGYGFSDGELRLAKMNYLMRGAYNCHNQYLEFLWEGGAILFVIFIIAVVIMCKKSDNTKQLRTTQILAIGVSAFFITFIAKAHVQMCPIYFAVLMALTNYSKELEASRVGKNGK